MRGHSRLLWLSLFLVLACSMPGCGGGGSTSTPTLTATTTSLALSKSTVNVGSPVTLTATVSTGSGTVTAGSVTFYEGATNLATVTLNSASQAVWSNASFTAGTHNLTASYGGSSAYAVSSSSAVTLTVNQPSQPSQVALALSPSNTTQGLPVKLVATVTSSSAAISAAPTGTVTFTNGSTTVGTATLDPTGAAMFTSTLLPVGTDSILATYSGDTIFSSSKSTPAAVTINKAAASTYTNPLTLNVTSSLKAVSCADPAIYKDQAGSVDTWYLYCTSDALYAGDTGTHTLGIYKSSDLVNWSYVGDALSKMPIWVAGSGGSLWAPAIKSFNGQYYLYFAASATNLAGHGSAIGVATSVSPAGPFVDSGAPVVEPELATNCCAGSYRSTIDPDEIQDASGQRYILFGSFVGGLYVRKLSADGLASDKTSEVHVAVDNRYEGGNWWLHDGYYYLFASSTNCCNGPFSGYGAFVGRATNPMGPYLDAQGIDMAATNPGGTPVLKMNANSIVGPGGNVIFTDESGRDYILYHGILASSPFYAGSTSYTARPAFIDALDWVNDWPVARGGFGPSDTNAPQPLPAAQPGAPISYTATLATVDAARSAIAALSDDFTATTLGSQWTFLHATPSYTLTGSAYQVSSVGFDPIGGMANVPLLAESAPSGDYMVETKVDFNLPASGVGPDFAQAGLLLYGDDQNFVRVDLYNNNDTRQVEFINATTPQAGYPDYWGATNLGPAAIATEVSVWMRLVKRNVDGAEHYTALSSNDGVTWIEGGTWVHALGASARICLYAGNRAGYTAIFSYVHVSTLQ